MNYSREKLMEIWRRAAPNIPAPDLFDTLVFSCDDEKQSAPEDGVTSKCRNSAESGMSGARRLQDASRDDKEKFPPEEPPDCCDPICERLRTAERGELALLALYGELVKLARTRRQRGLGREFLRLMEDVRAASNRTASTRYLACGDCPYSEPVRSYPKSLRDGIRAAWTLERALAREYIGIDCGMDELTRLHSAHSLRLRQLLEINL